jgi:hypothetical protein
MVYGGASRRTVPKLPVGGPRYVFFKPGCGGTSAHDHLYQVVRPRQIFERFSRSTALCKRARRRKPDATAFLTYVREHCATSECGSSAQILIPLEEQ